MLSYGLLSTTSLIALLALPAAAYPGSLLELITVDRLANSLAQSGVMAIRGFADLRYDDLDISPLEGRAVLSGAVLIPYEQNGDETCEIHLGRAMFTSSPLDQIEQLEGELDLFDLTVSAGCLDFSTRMMVNEIGLEALQLDHAALTLSYHVPSGGLEIDFSADMAGIAELIGEVDFSYFAVDLEREEPVAMLDHGVLEIIDRGYAQGLRPYLPPEITDPASFQAILLEELVLDELPIEVPPQEGSASGSGKGDDATGSAPLAEPPIDPARQEQVDSAEALIASVAQAAQSWANDPSRLLIEINPEHPVRLEEDLFEDFIAFAHVMQPQLESGMAEAPEPISTEQSLQIAAWLGGQDVDMPESDRLRYAEAFLSGLGVPRDIELGLELLTPLMESGQPMPIDTLIEHLDQVPSEFAYRVLRGAAASGNASAFANLDRVERELGLAQALSLQIREPASRDVAEGESARDLRLASFERLTGLDAPRDYMGAYYLALLARAGGDRGALAILDQIEEMGRGLEGEDAENWQQMLSDGRTLAMTHWFAMNDMPDEAPAEADESDQETAADAAETEEESGASSE